MSKLYRNAVKLLTAKREEGATLVEYGLLVALIAVACIGAITAVGTDISGLFTYLSGKITAVTGS